MTVPCEFGALASAEVGINRLKKVYFPYCIRTLRSSRINLQVRNVKHITSGKMVTHAKLQRKVERNMMMKVWNKKGMPGVRKASRMKSITTVARLLLFVGLAGILVAPATAGADNNPVRILFVTGGGFHDFATQEGILTEGLRKRFGEANIEFTVDHEAGKDPTFVPQRFSDPDFVKGYDLVLYNMGLSREQKPETAQAIIDSHVKHGVPAALIHGSTHSYRHTGNRNWFAFLGARSMSHERHRAFTNEVLVDAHPVMRDFPNPWAQEKGELYIISEVFPTATVLARAMGTSPARYQPTIWVNEYKGVRVFVTTIGHHNETMSSDVYLNLIYNGMKWAMDRE
jgi:uncharacterized protein